MYENLFLTKADHLLYVHLQQKLAKLAKIIVFPTINLNLK